MYTRFSTHTFFSLDDASFSITDYSALKFGSDRVARAFGYELAYTFFQGHGDTLLANRIVVIPSPYNHVENAATIMTRHFVDRLNELLVHYNGEHAEYDIIHRKVSYINDYGFLTKERRQGLIDNDRFYLNKQFLKDKLLIFIDDVRITGTHENKLVEILRNEMMSNQAFFVYYANYGGETAHIEAKLNFAAIETLADYLKIIKEPGHHVIVRPIKYLLGLPFAMLRTAISQMPDEFLRQVYYGGLGEGYYKLPDYQQNFDLIRNTFKARRNDHISALASLP